jgi:adenylylsulfate kinase
MGWRVDEQNSYRLRVPIPPSILCSALLINGTVGAGKTSVAEMVGDLLTEAGVPNAVIDLDWLRRSWPSPTGDRFNVAMALRNLRSVARNYRDAGAVRIVLAGVIETKINRDRHEDALGVPLSVCRLRVDLPLVRARLAQRHEGEGAVLQWYLARSGELDAILEAAAIEDFTVSATDLSIPSTAQDCALHSRLARTLPESVAGSATGTAPSQGARSRHHARGNRCGAGDTARNAA